MSKCDEDNINILLTEDNPDRRELLKRAIESVNKGYVVDESKDGQDCIKKLKEKEYNALLLDYPVPGKNGLEILRVDLMPPHLDTVGFTEVLRD